MKYLACLLLAAACTPVVAPVTPPVNTADPLPVFGTGYRADGDQCLRVGENDFTNQFLDDAADLVACPEGMENLGVFALDTGAAEVARTQGYVLYSVPVR